MNNLQSEEKAVLVTVFFFKETFKFKNILAVVTFHLISSEFNYRNDFFVARFRMVN